MYEREKKEKVDDSYIFLFDLRGTKLSLWGRYCKKWKNVGEGYSYSLDEEENLNMELIKNISHD